MSANRIFGITQIALGCALAVLAIRNGLRGDAVVCAVDGLTAAALLAIGHANMRGGR